jgi:hypothetical protein
MMKSFNWFRLLQRLSGGFTQTASIVSALVFFVKMCVAFTGFDAAMFVVCVLGFILLVIFEMFFHLCADGHDMMQSGR